jgi:hypothetical protein
LFSIWSNSSKFEKLGGFSLLRLCERNLGDTLLRWKWQPRVRCAFLNNSSQQIELYIFDREIHWQLDCSGEQNRVVLVEQLVFTSAVKALIGFFLSFWQRVRVHHNSFGTSKQKKGWCVLVSCHVLLLFELLFFAVGLKFHSHSMRYLVVSSFDKNNEERDKNSFIKMKSGLCCFQDNLCLAFARMKQ